MFAAGPPSAPTALTVAVEADPVQLDVTFTVGDANNSPITEFVISIAYLPLWPSTNGSVTFNKTMPALNPTVRSKETVDWVFVSRELVPPCVVLE